MKNSRVTLIRNQDLVFIFFKLVAQKLKLLTFHFELVTQNKTFYFSNLILDLIPQTKIWFFKESS